MARKLSLGADRQRLHRGLQGEARRRQFARPHRADLAGQAIAAEIAARKSADAVIIAEQGRWYTAVIRPLLAVPSSSSCGR